MHQHGVLVNSYCSHRLKASREWGSVRGVTVEVYVISKLGVSLTNTNHDNRGEISTSLIPYLLDSLNGVSLS